MFKIVYSKKVVLDDIPNITQKDRGIIKEAIQTKLTTKPAQYGKPLRRSLKGYRKLRVGDYRVVFRIQDEIIIILIIQHRKIVYQNALKRI